jgi:hypothetical protein
VSSRPGGLPARGRTNEAQTQWRANGWSARFEAGFGGDPPRGFCQLLPRRLSRGAAIAARAATGPPRGHRSPSTAPRAQGVWLGSFSPYPPLAHKQAKCRVKKTLRYRD